MVTPFIPHDPGGIPVADGDRLGRKLKRIEEARAEAPTAIAALRADLAEWKRYRHPRLEEFQARIARYEAFAAGGEFMD